MTLAASSKHQATRNKEQWNYQIGLNVQDLLAFDFNHYKLLKMFKKYNQSPFWTPKYIPVGKKKIINALIKA